MRVLLNLVKGFSATGKTLRMVLLLFVINLLFSMILAFPMYSSLKSSFGQSLVGENMAEGFDYLWWGEFMDSAKGLETTLSPSIIGKGAILNNLENLIQFRFFDLPSVIIILGILYVLLHTFLAGGILSIFMKETPRFSMKEFFNGAGTYFIRFFLLMLISWVFFFFIGSFLGGQFNRIINNVSKNSLSEVTPFYLGLLFSATIFFLLLFIQMVFDYGRIKIVLEDSRNVLRSASEAFVFVFKHLGSTLGLYYLIFLVNVVITLIYVLLKGLIPQSALLTVFIAFLIQQVFIFAIIWLRCWLYSSQMELYRYLK